MMGHHSPRQRSPADGARGSAHAQGAELEGESADQQTLLDQQAGALETARAAGISTLNDERRYGLSLVLGGAEVKLLELTGAYGVLANGGKAAPTNPILKIEDSRGKVLEELGTPKAAPALSAP